MALKKAFEDDAGVSVNYWRVHPHVILDFEKGTARGSLVPWVNENVRRKGKRPFNLHEVVDPKDARAVEEAMFLKLGKSDLFKEMKNGDLRNVFYKRLKALEIFADAEDVLESH